MRSYLLTLLLCPIFSQHLDTYDIPQRHLSAAYDLLSLTLTDTELDQILAHGCWCARINPDSNKHELGGTKTVDQLDSICKDWANVRHCNGLSGGSCQDGKFFTFQYTIGMTSGKWTCKHNKSKCLRETCKIDTHFVERVKEFLTDTNNLSKWGPKSSTCGAHQTTTAEPEIVDVSEAPVTSQRPVQFLTEEDDNPTINNGMAIIENPLEYFSTLAENSKTDDKTSSVFGENTLFAKQQAEKERQKIENQKAEKEDSEANYIISNPLEYFSQQSKTNKENNENQFGEKMQDAVNQFSAANEQKQFLSNVFQEMGSQAGMKSQKEEEKPYFMTNHEEFFGVKKETENAATRTEAEAEPEISFESTHSIHLGGAEISTGSDKYVHVGVMDSDGPRTVCRGKVPHLSIIHLSSRRRRSVSFDGHF